MQVGAGVLGLPEAVAQMGWVGGMLFLVFSIWVSWYTYKLLAYMHEVPDLDAPKGVRRLDRYDELAEYVLGECVLLVALPL
jgi:Transmembrane amino acid transporter protein